MILKNSGKRSKLISVRPIKDPTAIATTMNDYFVNITETIGLKQFQSDHLTNLFKDHTSIIRIKSNLDNASDKFDFKKVHEKKIKREIMNLNSKNMSRCYISQNS